MTADKQAVFTMFFKFSDIQVMSIYYILYYIFVKFMCRRENAFKFPNLKCLKMFVEKLK